MTRFGTLALAPLVGVLLGLAFPPYGFWPLGFLAIILLLSASWLVSWRWNLLVWWIAGTSFFLFLMPWLRVQIVGADAWLAASMALALWWLLASVGVGLVSRLPWAPIWIGSVLTTFEIMKSRWPWDGFPWGQFAFPLSDSYLGNYLPYVASLGLAWVGYTVCACIAWSLRGSSFAPTRRRWSWLLVAGSFLVLPVLLGAFSAGGEALGGANQKFKVAMVQGNVPLPNQNQDNRAFRVLDNHLELTNLLAAQIQSSDSERPDLVIWPENASDIDPFRSPSAYRAINETVDRLDVPVLVGAVISNPEDAAKVLNVGILWRPEQGHTSMYVKQNPVLFGEFLPFRPILSRLIGRFDRIPRDFAKGDKPGVFEVDGVAVGDVICFEVANDAVVRNTVRAGAELLVVQTNNSTWNLLGQTEQQLQIGRVRAKEFNRFVLVSATSGISAVVDNKGNILTQTEELTADLIEAEVPLIDSQTPSARFGHTITLVIFLAGWLAMAVGAFAAYSRARL